MDFSFTQKMFLYVISPYTKEIIPYIVDENDTFQSIIDDLHNRGPCDHLIYYNGIQSIVIKPNYKILTFFPYHRSQILLLAFPSELGSEENPIILAPLENLEEGSSLLLPLTADLSKIVPLLYPLDTDVLTIEDDLKNYKLYKLQGQGKVSVSDQTLYELLPLRKEQIILLLNQLPPCSNAIDYTTKLDVDKDTRVFKYLDEFGRTWCFNELDIPVLRKLGYNPWNNRPFDTSFIELLNSYQRTVILSEEELINKYGNLTKKLGSGAYAAVYATTKDYAIKVFLPYDDGEFKAGDIKEMSVLRRLHHPNVISLLGVSLSEKQIQMALNKGKGTLYDLSRQDIIIPEDRRKYIIYQILNGLAYCHSRHIWHRDIKMANILYFENDLIKIADFGLSKPYASDGETHTEPIASGYYRAPEVFLGAKNYNETVDIWSTGIILFELMYIEYQKRLTNFFKSYEEDEIMIKFVHLLGPPPGYNKLLPSKNVPISSETSSLPQTDWFTRLPRRHLLDEAVEVTLLPDTLLEKMSEKFDSNEIELLESMLTWNPEKRIKALDALRLPYFNSVRSKVSRNLAFVSTRNEVCANQMIQDQVLINETSFNKQNRYNILKWILDIILNFPSYKTLSVETFFLTQSLFDRYLEKVGGVLAQSDIKLVALTAFYISSQLSDSIPLFLNEAVLISKDRYTNLELIKSFLNFINLFNLDLISPTSYNFYVAYTEDPNKTGIRTINTLSILSLSYEMVTTYSPAELAQLSIEYVAYKDNLPLPNCLNRKRSLLDAEIILKIQSLLTTYVSVKNS